MPVVSTYFPCSNTLVELDRELWVLELVLVLVPVLWVLDTSLLLLYHCETNYLTLILYNYMLKDSSENVIDDDKGIVMC